MQGQRRALNSGDEICLIKCKDKKDQEASSFIFQLLNARPVSRRMGLFSPLRQASSLRSSPSGSLGVFGGGRRIEDLYDIREEIGRGTCGRVHVGVNRLTRQDWEVKVRPEVPGPAERDGLRACRPLIAAHAASSWWCCTWPRRSRPGGSG